MLSKLFMVWKYFWLHSGALALNTVFKFVHVVLMVWIKPVSVQGKSQLHTLKSGDMWSYSLSYQLFQYSDWEAFCVSHDLVLHAVILYILFLPKRMELEWNITEIIHSKTWTLWFWTDSFPECKHPLPCLFAVLFNVQYASCDKSTIICIYLWPVVNLSFRTRLLFLVV
jgi:hypothetical protein